MLPLFRSCPARTDEGGGTARRVDARWQSYTGTARGARILITGRDVSSDHAGIASSRRNGHFWQGLALAPLDCSTRPGPRLGSGLASRKVLLPSHIATLGS